MTQINRDDFDTIEEYAAALEEQNKAMRAKEMAGNALRFKVTVPRAAGTHNADDKGTDGGAISVYGLGRFPVTLFKEQWLRLLSHGAELVAFMKEHDEELSVKIKKAA